MTHQVGGERGLFHSDLMGRLVRRQNEEGGVEPFTPNVVGVCVREKTGGIIRKHRVEKMLPTREQGGANVPTGEPTRDRNHFLI